MAKDLKPDMEDRISKLQIPGIVTVGTSKRVYPNGSVAGGIVGFLQDGASGQAGLEQTQDEVLKGTPGKRLFEIGADGLRIPVGVDELTPPSTARTSGSPSIRTSNTSRSRPSRASRTS